MTKDDLYPETQDKQRDRSKTYYVPQGCSFGIAQEDPDPELNCFNPEDGEFRNCHDPWWLEQRGQDYSQMPDDYVPYREKNDDLAGKGEQGAAGGGGGGCGGGGGACGAKAAAQSEKDSAKGVLDGCKSGCQAAMGASANPEALLSGLISLATAVLGITDLLSSLIKPEMLSEMEKMIDSTKTLMADAATAAVSTAASCCGGCGGGCSRALSVAKAAVEAAIAMETGDVQMTVMAAMDVAESGILADIASMTTSVAGDCGNLAQMAGDANAALNSQLSAFTDAKTSVMNSVGGCQAAMSSAMAAASGVAAAQIADPVTAIAVQTAMTAAETAMNSEFDSVTQTMKSALDANSILGVV